MQATSSFETVLTIPCLNNLKLNVNIIKGQNIKDVVFHLVQLHAIPPYITTCLVSSILSTMTEINKKQPPTTKTVSKQDLRHQFMDAYQSNTLYYNNKPEEVKYKILFFCINMKN
jgi:hypothetical protein